MTMTTYSQQNFIILMVSSKDLEVRSANDFIKGLLYNESYIKCIGFVQTCFQSQTYSFEVAQEHIETLQRK